MSTAVTPQSVSDLSPQALSSREIRIYSHSMIFYWWPVWAVGYMLALITYVWGTPVHFEDPLTHRIFDAKIHPNHSLGVIFTFTFLLVMIMTHFAVRGVASLTVIITGIAVVLFISYMGWWDSILQTLGNLAIYMNLGFYVFFSTAMFLVWAYEAFIQVRLDYYLFRPGQLVHVTAFGGGEETFDTRGLSVVKMRDDMFRHWILGLGSGDLHVATVGARKAEFVVHNVLFVGHKLTRIQQLVAMQPDERADNVFTAGQPV